MMGKFEDLTGKRFGRLLVIERLDNRIISKKSRVFYLCKCDCGIFKVKSADTLRSGDVRSCGCLQKEVAAQVLFRRGADCCIKHGLYNHPLYETWEGMVQRCENPNARSYKYCGGRGVSICKEWRKNPEIFIKWGLATGWKKGLTIDRIDNDGNYCLENCQWLTRGENTKKAHRDRREKMKVA